MGTGNFLTDISNLLSGLGPIGDILTIFNPIIAIIEAFLSLFSALAGGA